MAGIENTQDDQPIAIGTGNDTPNSHVDAVFDIVTVNVFFDGTGNNQQNTLNRLKNESYFQEMDQKIKDITDEIIRNQEEQRVLLQKHKQLPRGDEKNKVENLWREIDVINRDLVFKREKITEELNKNDLYKIRGETSYGNDFTNVALLEMATSKTPIKPIYIQGAGTREGKKDVSLGLGMAMGETGVIQRVNEAFEKVAKLIEEKGIKRLQLNVFGFSRGAFYARVFCAWMKTPKPSVMEKMMLKVVILSTSPIDLCARKVRSQIDLDVDDIKINLVGLFDTVSSYQKNHYDNPQKIAMSIGKEQDIYRVVHFTAQNEYRYHFPLTPIDTALNTGCGLEFSFPGAHSNIGGSYTDHFAEEYHYLSVKNDAELMPGKVSFIPSDHILFKKRRDGEIPWQWWVDKGYYAEDTLKIRCRENEDYQDFSNKLSGEVFGHRKVRHHYQYIYLNGMKHFAEEIGKINFSEKNKEYQERQSWFETRKQEDPEILGKIDSYVQEVIQANTLSLGKISVVTEKVLPSKEACQSLYRNYIFNSMMPIPFKLVGYAKDGLDKDADWDFLPGVANKGNDNNLGNTGNPQRPIVKGG